MADRGRGNRCSRDGGRSGLLLVGGWSEGGDGFARDEGRCSGREEGRVRVDLREEMWALGVAGGWGEKGEWLVLGAGNGDWGRELGAMVLGEKPRKRGRRRLGKILLTIIVKILFTSNAW